MGKLQINGDLLLAGNLMMSTSNVSAYSVISVKPDSNAYGQNLIIGAGGNTVIGGGESALTFFTASGIKDEENLYLTADGSIHVYTNCDSIANRKLVMSMEADGNITTTGTIITPGNDSVVIKPAKNNYDQIGASDCKFWKVHAGTFYGNLSGNADTASRLLNKYNISGDSHSLALKAAFDTYKNSTPKDEFLTYYSSAYGNGSMYMGYFISGYDSSPYGGFYVAHYNTPYYVGIQYGNYEQQTILTSSNYATWCASASHTHSYLPLSGGTMSGSPVIKFPASQGSIATSDPMAITYGRISAYGTLCINADSDGSTDEYLILTSGRGLSGSTADGLAIGYNTLTWQNNTIIHSSNYTSYTVTKTGSGASGTWGINVTGSANYAQYLNTVAGNEIRFHNATGLTAGGSLWLGWSWADGNKTVTKDWYIGNFSGGGLANVYAANFIGAWQGNSPSAFAPASHSHSYVPISGGTMTGKLQVNNIIFSYNYSNNNNAPAFVWDKPGSHYTGVGASGTDTIKFGPVNSDGTFTWVNGFAQHWVFQGTIRPGCIILTNDQWTGYGTADPNDLGLDKVVGRVYFKI